MPNLQLTDFTIRRLPHGSRIDYWDRQLSSFGVRVGTRTKTFMVKVKNRRIAIGHYPNLSLKDARRKAHVLLGTYVQQGTMPYAEARDDFIREHCEKKNKPSTAAETKRLLNRFSFGGTLGQVTKREILEQLRSFPASEANHAFTAMRTLLNWAVEHEYLAHTPLHKVKLPHKPQSRDRLLTDDEIKTIWNASRAHGDFGCIVRSLILSGQRLNQIASYDDAWTRTDTIVFPGFIMKSNREHTLPLTKALAENLPSLATPFTLETKAMRALRHDLEDVPHWTLHDFRRYFSSTMAMLGTPLHVTERLLDHRTGSESAVARIYNRHNFRAEMRNALEIYERHLIAVLTDDPRSNAVVGQDSLGIT